MKIANERQYWLTRSEVVRFRNVIKAYRRRIETDIHPRILRAEREAMESVLVDLEAELAEYEARAG